MGPIYPSSALQAPRIEYGAGSSPLRVEGKTSAIPAAQLSAYNKGVGRDMLVRAVSSAVRLLHIRLSRAREYSLCF